MDYSSELADYMPDSALLEGLNFVSAQLLYILDSLSAEDYTKSSPERSSFGAHVRHIIEFMQAAQFNERVVDYDGRKRNAEIEQSIDAARGAINDVISSLSDRLSKYGAAYSVSMIEKLSENHKSIPVPSTLGREIAYAVQHGIHHVFIIKTVAEMHGINLDKEIGVAPATMEYEKQ